LLKAPRDRAEGKAPAAGEEGRREVMKLDRGLVLAAAMAVVGIVATGCKSSANPPDDTANPQPGVQAPSNSAAPSNDDPDGRRAHRRHGHRRGHGDWKRRAQAQDPGASPAPIPDQQ
jgi:hypothetical protein